LTNEGNMNAGMEDPGPELSKWAILYCSALAENWSLVSQLQSQKKNN